MTNLFRIFTFALILTTISLVSANSNDTKSILVNKDTSKLDENANLFAITKNIKSRDTNKNKDGWYQEHNYSKDPKAEPTLKMLSLERQINDTPIMIMVKDPKTKKTSIMTVDKKTAQNLKTKDNIITDVFSGNFK